MQAEKYWKIITLKRFKCNKNSIAFDIDSHFFILRRINTKNYGIEFYCSTSVIKITKNIKQVRK